MAGKSGLCIFFLACVVSLAHCKVELRPSGFIKLPNSRNAVGLGIGAANKAAYDSVSKLMYVVGHNADVMNVIDMRDSKSNPVHGRTITFDALNQGLPNDVKVCRGGLGREYLSISFESKDLSERGHVHFYQLLSDPQEVLIRLKTVTTVEGFDPRATAWNKMCTELIVTSVGDIHTINGVFEDPRPSVDVLVPSFGLNVDRRSIPFSETALKTANVREVFTTCDSGTHTATSTHVQDLEPVHVAVDDNDIAYLLFQPNNAIGRMDLKDPFAQMTYHNLGLKDWSKYTMDTSQTDGLKLNRHTMMSMYQPSHAVAFPFGNKTWLATADTGKIKQYNVRVGSTTLCAFDESSDGRSWRQAFTSLVPSNVATELTTNLTNVLSTMRFTRLKTFQDGYNPLQQGYNYLTTYGARGWSLMDTTTMTRVYDSGDALEAYYTWPDATDPQKAVYNSYYSNPGHSQSQMVDKTSNQWGPNPTAIATGNINGTQVVVVANGYVGGLYAFSVTANSTGGPYVKFEDFVRRGSPGLTWDAAYKQTGDAVGEPGITDLLWIQDDGENVLVAISSIASAASFYTVQFTPDP